MMARGAVAWADLEPVQGHEQGGRRPVLVVSRPSFNERSRTVISMPITSKPPPAPFPFSLELPPALLPKPSWVKPTQVRVISTLRLGAVQATAPPAFVNKCLTALLEHCSP